MQHQNKYRTKMRICINIFSVKKANLFTQRKMDIQSIFLLRKWQICNRKLTDYLIVPSAWGALSRSICNVSINSIPLFQLFVKDLSQVCPEEFILLEIFFLKYAIKYKNLKDIWFFSNPLFWNLRGSINPQEV